VNRSADSGAWYRPWAPALWLMAVLEVTGTAGCKPERPDGDSAPIAKETQDTQAANIDRLRSLPYVGFSSQKADEGESGVVRFDAQRSCPGYNLYSSHKLCSASLIDARGEVIRFWEHPGRHWTNCRLLPNGDLLVVGRDRIDDDRAMADDVGRFVLRLSWEGRVLWKKTIPAHHDAEWTPDGGILTFVTRRRRSAAISLNVDIRDNELTLLSADGQVVDHCSLLDVCGARPDLFTFQPVAPKTRQWIIDLFHCNSVEWIRRPDLEPRHPIYASGNVLICSRHQDTIAVIDWDKKELVWAWGQGEISGPHDATLLDSGNILLFDNGLGRGWSRVIELDPLTETIVWEYRAPEPTDFYTKSRGSSQRLANGNTLIANSDNGQAFEVTPDGEIVWEFLSPHVNAEGYRGTIVRMKRYPLSYVDSIIEQHEGADRDAARP